MNLPHPNFVSSNPAHASRTGTTGESIPLVDSNTIQVDDLSTPLAPSPNRLTRCGTITHGLMYCDRVIGAGMFSTGVTSEICRHMMNNPNPKTSTGLLIGLGATAYLAGVIGSACQTSSAERLESIRQSLKDAVVPSLVSFSVYLALSHGVI